MRNRILIILSIVLGFILGFSIMAQRSMSKQSLSYEQGFAEGGIEMYKSGCNPEEFYLKLDSLSK